MLGKDGPELKNVSYEWICGARIGSGAERTLTKPHGKRETRSRNASAFLPVGLAVLHSLAVPLRRIGIAVVDAIQLSECS